MILRKTKVAFFWGIICACFGGACVHSTLLYLKYQKRQERIFDRVSSQAVSLGSSSFQEQDLICMKQPFFYLAKGKQTYVYESADGQYVLKLFKNRRKNKRSKNFYDGVNGALLAKKYLLEESAICIIHLGSIEKNIPPVRLLDKRGMCHQVDLTTIPFIVQKKAASLKKTLLKLVSQNKISEAESSIRSLFVLLKALRDKGIVDMDGSVVRNENIGLINGKAILLDTGKLFMFHDTRRQTLHDIHRLKPFLKWLKESLPELVPVFIDAEKKYEIL